MKQCPQCQQRFSDENSFCLMDGTPLSYLIDEPEEATVIRSSPSIQQPVSIVKQGVSPIFAYLFAALVLLIIAGVAIWGLKSFLTIPSPNSTASILNSNKDLDSANQQKANLQDQQTALELEKQRLAEDRKKLDALKNKPVEPPPTLSAVQPTARINFHRGSVQETISGVVGSQRSYVLAAKSGQYLSASISSGNGCVVFGDGSTSTSYTTIRGDNRLSVVNNCGSQASFNLTVYIR